MSDYEGFHAGKGLDAAFQVECLVFASLAVQDESCRTCIGLWKHGLLEQTHGSIHIVNTHVLDYLR
jgi:hypothetical protein